MKLSKLAVLSVAVLGSSAAMSANVVTTAADTTKNVIVTSTGAVVDTGKTLFETATHPAAVSAEIGTMGYGANIAWGLNEGTELQAGWSGMNFDGDEDLNANDSWINYSKLLGDGYGDFKGDLKYDFDFSNPYIGVQMRPFNNNFTVAGGVMVPDNKVKLDIQSESGEQTVTIDDVPYDISEASIKAKNKNKIAPYATIGYRPNINQNWGGFVEVGASYMGKLEVKDINASGTDAASFEDAAKNEIETDNFWYPIVKAGVTYRF